MLKEIYKFISIVIILFSFKTDFESLKNRIRNTLRLHEVFVIHNDQNFFFVLLYDTLARDQNPMF